MASAAPAPTHLVEALYEAVADPDGWPAFLAGLAGAVGGAAPGLFVTDLCGPRNLLKVTSGVDPAWDRLYESRFQGCDPWRSHLRTLQAGSVFVASALVPKREIEGGPFDTEFLAPWGFGDMIGAVPTRREDLMAVLRVMRPRHAPPVGGRETAVLRGMVPHLGRAVRLFEQLAAAEARRDEAIAVLDRFPASVLLLDAAGRLLAANRQGERLLATGEALRAGRDVVRAVIPAETAQLHRLIAEAAGRVGPAAGSEGTMNVRRLPPRRPLNLLVAPVRGGSLGRVVRPAAVVVFVTDQDRLHAPAAEPLARWLGLTRAEGVLVGELLQGRCVEEAAVVLGISPHTARTQLKRVLTKTGTGRQPELVRLALGTPEALLRQSD